MSFQNWWNNCNVNDRNKIALSPVKIIFGYYESPSKYTINNCLLQAKYYIHKELCKNQNITFAGYLNYLKYKIEVEQHILNTQGKQGIFRKRWSDILSALQS